MKKAENLISLADLRYDEKKDYVEPTEEQLDQLIQMEEYQSFALEDPNNTDSVYDIRTIVRILLWQRYRSGKLSHELYERLIEPYDNEFYKKANGKSAPSRFKVMGLQKMLGIQKDIVSVRHDYDYYRNDPGRIKSDFYFLKSQIAVGQLKIFSLIEFVVLLLVGWFPFMQHRHRSEWIMGYGTDEFITNLENIKGVPPEEKKEFDNKKRNGKLAYIGGIIMLIAYYLTPEGLGFIDIDFKTIQYSLFALGGILFIPFLKDVMVFLLWQKAKDAIEEELEEEVGENGGSAH